MDKKDLVRSRKQVLEAGNNKVMHYLKYLESQKLSHVGFVLLLTKKQGKTFLWKCCTPLYIIDIGILPLTQVPHLKSHGEDFDMDVWRSV